MAIVRSIKNYAKGFSEVQIKVREATSNDSWGPSGSLMNEIAQLTFNEQDFIEIMDMLDRRLNDKGKNWRHVFKALLVLDYCLHVGSENVVLYAKENIYVVRTLKEFQHIDDSGKDVGFNVRQKAKDITSLLLDENRLKEERKSRIRMADSMAGVGDYMNDVLRGGPGGSSSNNDGQAVYKQPGYVDEDKDLKRAIEESKRMAEQEFRNRGEGTDADLQKAIEESEKEARESERKKREALERESQNNLFGSNSQQVQNTFQPFPATQSFDASLNPYGQSQIQAQAQQWPQATGFTGMSFAEPIQQQQSNPYSSGGFNNFNLQAQMTGVPASSLQAQMTGFVPQQYFQTQKQPQFTGMNPFGGTAQQQGQQFGGQQQGGQQNASTIIGSSVQQQSIFGTPNLNNSLMMQQQSPVTTTTPASNNEHYSKLNSMLANRDDGMDTFGNTGNLRIPYGTGFASTLVPQQKKDVLSITDSPSSASFSQPFAQQPSRNPFGQPSTTTTSTATTSGGGQQKSLLEMMQEQKLQQQQQQLQAQMTGYPQQQQPQQQQQGYMFNSQQQQPQMTGVGGIQPQPTSAYSMMNQQQQPFSQQPQQQQPFNFSQQQPSFF